MSTKTVEPQPAICLHCGAVEEMHHAFEAYVREPGCVCAQSGWPLLTPLTDEQVLKLASRIEAAGYLLRERMRHQHEGGCVKAECSIEQVDRAYLQRCRAALKEVGR